MIVFSFVSTYCHAQSYGLQFAGNEVVQDARTGLDLGAGSPLSLAKNFTLSFEFAFLPGQREYFGYILRLIDNKNNNIDILYDTNLVQMMIVADGRPFDFPDSIEKSMPFKQWTKVVLSYNQESKILAVTIGNKNFQQKATLFPTSLRIAFGVNNNKGFKTTDVPSMKIRDIRITENKKLRYYWPLNDKIGNKAQEIEEEKNATVSNPNWIKLAYSEWTKLRKFDAKGRVSTAFDPEHDLIYIVAKDSLYTFSINSKLLTVNAYASGPSVLLKGNQSYYDKESHQLYNLHIEQGIISKYDWSKRLWDKKPKPDPISDVNFWHFNKLWAPDETSFYIFNGYGHFKYKNLVRRFDMATGAVQSLKPTGDYFAPRYLSGLGPAKGGAYIIGGYGSMSGEQTVNPKNFYDLFYFNIKNNSFKKIYQLRDTSEDFVFSNSLIIDEASNSFYGLIFPKHKYNSHLQLVRGSLTKPEIQELGNKIPFTFRDNNSFSDLFYSPNTKKFVAVTLSSKSDELSSEVAIYSLNSPPLPVEITAYNQAASLWKTWHLWAIFPFTVIILFFIIKIIRAKKAKSSRAFPVTEPNLTQINKSAQQPESLNLEDASLPLETIVDETLPDKSKITGMIYLFGDLEVFDSDTVDITRYFTPLIKELFLAILLYTIRWKRGISSVELTELLWFDKSSESARNNRSVNIAKLKTILDKMQYCQLSKETGNWRVNIDHERIQIDYYDYFNIIQDKSKLDKQKIKELAEIIKRGSFLKKLDYEWLDTFKSEISNELIDTYLHFAKSTLVSEDPEFLIRIAGYIFYFDPVNEEAMIIKCKALAYLGKHSLAKEAFENFCREYKAIYGKDFQQDFNSILEQSLHL